MLAAAKSVAVDYTNYLQKWNNSQKTPQMANSNE